MDLPDKTTSEGLFDLPYGFADQRMEHVCYPHGGAGGLLALRRPFAQCLLLGKSFIDELAAETKTDPVEFRRALLKQAPRYLAVLNLAADKAGWGGALPPGARGAWRCTNRSAPSSPRWLRFRWKAASRACIACVCAADCGTVVNPNIVAQQMESSVIFGLTAALYGRIDIHEGVVQQGNFPSYPMVGLAQAPHVETWLIASQRPPGGVGEPGVPPIAPAVANALFKLTGQRRRALPLIEAGELQKS